MLVVLAEKILLWYEYQWVVADLLFVLVGLHIGEDREVSSREAIWPFASLTFSADCWFHPREEPGSGKGNPFALLSSNNQDLKLFLSAICIYRLSHHICSICRNGLIHMAHPLLRLPPALLP